MTIPDFRKRKAEGHKIVVVTAYDALFTRIAEEAGLEVLLVGDSLGVVVQGKKDTLSVTMEDMLYHTRLVAGAAQHALVIADMPFLSYQVSVDEAVRNAGRFLQVGAAAVKLEGGAAVVDRVQAMTRFGLPVMGHLGMTPQSVHRYGGYKVQGKEREKAEALLADAKALEAAGAFAIALEAIPASLAKTITEVLTIPTIGIGAGPHCDGQVLVLYDLLGLIPDFQPKFVKRYAELYSSARTAAESFLGEVREGRFPEEKHSFQAKTLRLIASNAEPEA